MPAGISAATLVRPAHSVPAGLLEVAEEYDAGAVVVGSSSTGVFGRVALGSVSGWLVHSSPILIALPPRGYRGAPDRRVTRITVAYGGRRAGTWSPRRSRSAPGEARPSRRALRPDLCLRRERDGCLRLRAGAGRRDELIHDLAQLPSDLVV